MNHMDILELIHNLIEKFFFITLKWLYSTTTHVLPDVVLIMLGVTTYRYVLFNYQDFCNSIRTYLCFFFFLFSFLIKIR